MAPPSGSASGATRARRGEGDKLRDAIILATLELLDETQSADAVSIRAVADRVGKTPPSIYLHFADKDALMVSVCEVVFADIARRFDEAQQGIDDPVERGKACARAYVRFAVDHPEQYRILFMEVYRGSPEGMPLDLDALKENVAFAELYRNIVEAFDAGAFAGSDPDTAALIFWANVHGIASLLIAKPGFAWPDVDDWVAASCRQSIDGLRPR